MAQGQVKKKAGKNKKKSSAKKHAGPKKGARAIAPKKAKLVKAAKFKKSFEKAIKSNMEQELASHAVTKGSKPLAMVKFDEHEKKGGNKNRQDKKKGR